MQIDRQILTHKEILITRFTIRDQLTQLHRIICSKICCQPNDLRTRRTNVLLKFKGKKKTDLPAQSSQAGEILFYWRKGQTFCSTREGNQFYCLPMSILTSYKNIFTETPRIMFVQLSGHSHGLIKLIYKINSCQIFSLKF